MGFNGIIMPNYTKEEKENRAKLLVKSCLDKGLNQSAVAREKGISQQAINQRMHKPAVRSALQEAFRKIGISTRYKAKKFKELLEQKKLQDCDIFIKDENGKLKVNKNSNDFIEVEDGNVRLGALKLLCQVEGDLKENGNGKGGNIVIQIIRPENSNPDTNDRIHIQRTSVAEAGQGIG